MQEEPTEAIIGENFARWANGAGYGAVQSIETHQLALVETKTGLKSYHGHLEQLQADYNRTIAAVLKRSEQYEAL